MLSKCALITKSRSYSYGQLFGATIQAEAWLKKQGLVGKRVAVLGGNSGSVLALYLGALIGNTTLVFLHDLENGSPAEWKSILNQVNTEAFLFDQENFSKPRLEGTNCLSIPKWDFETGSEVEFDISKALSGGVDGVFLQAFTSGSTGNPKGVCLSRGNLLCSAKNIKDAMSISHNDRVLIAGHLSNTTGLPLTLATLMAGATTIFMPWEEDRFSWIKRHEVTAVMLSPFDMVKAQGMDMDVPSLKTIAFGTAPMNQSTLSKMQAKLPSVQFIQGYGLTELSGPVCWHKIVNEKEVDPSIIGKPASDVEIKIADSSGNPCDTGQIGELQVKGPMVMAGYWNPETKQADEGIVGGWFATGDLCQWQPNGELKLVGRKKDSIVTSDGYTFHPREVEFSLMKSLRVDEVAVLGVILDESGEIPIAVINCTDSLPDHTIVNSLRDLSSEKRPLYFLVNQCVVPRNRNKKIIRSELAENAASLIRSTSARRHEDVYFI